MTTTDEACDQPDVVPVSAAVALEAMPEPPASVAAFVSVNEPAPLPR